MRTMSATASAADVPIEPRISEQWFLRYPKTKEALAVVRDHLIRFFPSALGESLRSVAGEHSATGALADNYGGGTAYRHGTRKCCKFSNWPNPKEARDIYVGIQPPADAENWIQDDDTLDTWFSSWLWAYETMDRQKRGRNFIQPACS